MLLKCMALPSASITTCRASLPTCIWTIALCSLRMRGVWRLNWNLLTLLQQRRAELHGLTDSAICIKWPVPAATVLWNSMGLPILAAHAASRLSIAQRWRSKVSNHNAPDRPDRGENWRSEPNTGSSRVLSRRHLFSPVAGIQSGRMAYKRLRLVYSRDAHCDLSFNPTKNHNLGQC